MKIEFEGRSFRGLQPPPGRQRSSGLRLGLSNLYFLRKPGLEFQSQGYSGGFDHLANEVRSHLFSRISRGLRCEDDGPRLWDIPAEILIMIADHLDVVSTACLRNTNSYFRNSIPDDSRFRNRCVKPMMIARLEGAMPQLPKKSGLHALQAPARPTMLYARCP